MRRPFIGAHPLKELSEHDVRAVLRAIVARGTNRAAVVMRNNLIQIFAWARKRQPWRKLLVDGDPMELIEIEKIDPTTACSQIVCQTVNHHAIVRHMENYSPPLNDVFHALADPTRRSVIARLGRGSASIKELAEPFGLGLPSFLKHIKVLESSGLIASEKTGRVRTCTLRRGNLTAAEKWFDEQRAAWESRYENLDNLLTTLKGEENES